ncbi:hypothetical protein C8R44DRAFT_741175 [Mycena epipterygia]|nr:hypothetical protein C8R44DRAFT_741175 [Mycena epipterygia]
MCVLAQLGGTVFLPRVDPSFSHLAPNQFLLMTTDFFCLAFFWHPDFHQRTLKFLYRIINSEMFFATPFSYILLPRLSSACNGDPSGCGGNQGGTDEYQIPSNTNYLKGKSMQARKTERGHKTKYSLIAGLSAESKAIKIRWADNKKDKITRER